jgi:hypothetical protein
MATTYQSNRFGTLDDARRPARDAVSQVNAQFVDLLCSHAEVHTVPFPLPRALRERLAILTDIDRSRLARCGTLLVDIGLAEPHRWRTDSDMLETANWAIARSGHWLLPHEGFLIAHATILIVWSILHSNSSESDILLGTSAESARVIATMGVNKLSRIAQRHPEWVQVRWAHVPQVWWELLDFATASDPSRFRLMSLRCLQMSGSQFIGQGRKLPRPRV